ERAKRIRFVAVDDRTLYVHADYHCVATRPANPAKLRMLTETAPNRRRLFRRGDPYDRSRAGPETRRGTRHTPFPEDLPDEYRPLLDWYCTTYSPRVPESPTRDPILALRGLGKQIWDEQPDEYVERVRAGWV